MTRESKQCQSVESREKVLKAGFNDFFQKVTAKKEDYYSKIEGKRLFELKNIVKNVNNILTLKTSLRFINYLKKIEFISAADAKKMKKKVDETKPNANGFDIQYDEKGRCKILAEVKCNIPINNGDKFGSAQKNAIINDIDGLNNPKLKTKVRITADASTYYRFMVFLDTGDGRVENAVKALMDESRCKFSLIPSNKKLSRGKTYVAIV